MTTGENTFKVGKSAGAKKRPLREWRDVQQPACGRQDKVRAPGKVDSFRMNCVSPVRVGSWMLDSQVWKENTGR